MFELSIVSVTAIVGCVLICIVAAYEGALSVKTFLLLLAVFGLILLIASDADAQSRRVNVNVNRDSDIPIHHTGPLPLPDSPTRACFPFCSGGITKTERNPIPRTNQEMTSCAYDTNGELFFEQAGVNCPYEYTDEHALRMAFKRREHQQTATELAAFMERPGNSVENDAKAQKNMDALQRERATVRREWKVIKEERIRLRNLQADMEYFRWYNPWTWRNW